MITLSPRLQMAASLVPVCHTISDVGTDHGYLGAWLLENGKAQRVFATDIHAGPLSRARQTVEALGLQDRMELYLCDGLQFQGADASQAVVICGMGGETMISILEAAPWTWNRTTLILQPQSKQTLLFDWLREHDICISAAKLCVDSGRRYLAFRAGDAYESSCTVEDYLLRDHDPLFPDHLREEIRRLSSALEGISASARDLNTQCQQLQDRISYLQHYQEATKAWYS